MPEGGGTTFGFTAPPSSKKVCCSVFSGCQAVMNGKTAFLKQSTGVPCEICFPDWASAAGIARCGLGRQADQGCETTRSSIPVPALNLMLAFSK